jgi:predicted carbohydrate-binding protein with CBM48
MPDEQKTRCEPAIPAREHLSKQSASFAEARPARRAPEGLARRLPIGSEPQPDGGVTFRVWAPRCGEVLLEFEAASENSVALQPEPGGYFSLTAPTAKAGMRYRFRLDRGETSLPDPASRYQPEGPQGFSELVDPGPSRGQIANGVACRASSSSSTNCTSAPLLGRERGKRRPVRLRRSPLSALPASKSCPLPSSRADSAGDTTG